jgi:hypothetical protein
MPVVPGRHAFFRRTGSATVSAHNGRVNEQVFKVRVSDAILVEFLPHTLFAPPSEAFVDAIPIAILCGQESPLRS